MPCCWYYIKRCKNILTNCSTYPSTILYSTERPLCESSDDKKRNPPLILKSCENSTAPMRRFERKTFFNAVKFSSAAATRASPERLNLWWILYCVKNFWSNYYRRLRITITSVRRLVVIHNSFKYVMSSFPEYIVQGPYVLQFYPVERPFFVANRFVFVLLFIPALMVSSFHF